MKKIIFVVNAPEYFVSHRIEIAKAAKSFGAEIHVIAPPEGQVNSKAKGAIRIIENNGFIYHEVKITRGGQNPFSEFLSIWKLFLLYRNVKPDLVHLVTLKPVLYGGVAARFANVKSVVAAVSGLGTVFVAESLIARIRRLIVVIIYKLSFNQRNLVVVFQNPDDREVLLKLGVVEFEQTRLLRGSGVDLKVYPYLPEPLGTPVVVMASRLLKDKGLYEYVAASRILRERGINVVMKLIGATDPGNPTSVTDADLDDWRKEGVIDFWGYRTDIAQQYASANIVCLPSYREGLPKCLVEAAACGRAVITTDAPGCRDAIEPNVTGLLVPIKNSEALADAIQVLLESPKLRSDMGKAGRELAEKKFGIANIVNQHLIIYQELLSNE
ncbi:glycosyltransferase family 4 protein [Desulfuromonas acetoxidans]|uniref:glycosyltransferase family 4 protein n=1 Tax=Desulfuromonas acetoxidans TaxID=891 RepID=UPI00292CCDAF|nr:glycosyltransferase family 4 protein [Desulfuromonas acetoxidans]